MESHGNQFRIVGDLCGEAAATGGFTKERASYAILWSFLWLIETQNIVILTKVSSMAAPELLFSFDNFWGSCE